MTIKKALLLPIVGLSLALSQPVKADEINISSIDTVCQNMDFDFAKSNINALKRGVSIARAKAKKSLNDWGYSEKGTNEAEYNSFIKYRQEGIELRKELKIEEKKYNICSEQLISYN